MSRPDLQTYLDEYARSYSRANPGKRITRFENNRGWYHFTIHGGSGWNRCGPYRLRQIQDMTRVLNFRADNMGC